MGEVKSFQIRTYRPIAYYTYVIEVVDCVKNISKIVYIFKYYRGV